MYLNIVLEVSTSTLQDEHTRPCEDEADGGDHREDSLEDPMDSVGLVLNLGWTVSESAPIPEDDGVVEEDEGDERGDEED